MITIQPEPPEAAREREKLLDRAFGPARFGKTAERLREGRLPAAGLSFAAYEGDCLAGTIRFWHVTIGNREALLLGPVAVAESHRGRGVGAALIRRGLASARALGYAAVILVGDEPYYRCFGFRAALTQRMLLPGPVDRHRFLALELAPSALASVSGMVRPTGRMDIAWRRRTAA